MNNKKRTNYNLSFKNIVSITKYNFIAHRIAYMVEAIILVLCLLGTLFISKFTRGLELVPYISIVLIINFIYELVLFYHQISKDQGRLLFLTSIKGLELILGNFIEFLASSLLIIIACTLCSGSAAGKFPSLLVSVALPILGGLIVSYLVVSSAITIATTYISQTGLRVIAIVLGCIFGNSIYDLISKGLLKLLPYVYISIDGFYSFEIDLFSFILGAIALIGLQIFCAHLIDKKLDIA